MILAAAVLAVPAAEARVLWVDATANLSWSISADKVQDFCKKAKDSGFNELVVDVKPINGKLLFAAPDTERFKAFRDIQVPPGYDLLGEFSRATKAVGIRLSAGVNALSEGHSYFPGIGKAYEDESWQTLCAVPVYEIVLKDKSRLPFILGPSAKAKQGFVTVSNAASAIAIPGTDYKIEAHPQDAERVSLIGIDRMEHRMELQKQTQALPEMVAVFVDPLHSLERHRLLTVIRSLAKYDLNGLVFDRLRFPGLTGGFGQEMRLEFERRHGPVSKWPDSIFRATGNPNQPYEKGPRYAEWMQFRAETVTELLHDMKSAAKDANPKWTIGSYVGAGWETYYEVGVNYATDATTPPYDWATPEHGLAGYARLLDFIMPGVFYRVARSVDPGVAPGRGRFTVEGGAKLMSKLAGDATLIYPALYGLDWENNEDGLREAIRSARKVGNGVMMFDASYVVKNNWWPLFKAEFANAPLVPPHALPSYPRVKKRGA